MWCAQVQGSLWPNGQYSTNNCFCNFSKITIDIYLKEQLLLPNVKYNWQCYKMLWKYAYDIDAYWYNIADLCDM